MPTEIIGNKSELIDKINNQIELGTNLKSNQVESWITTITKILEREFSDNKISNDLQLKVFFEESNKLKVAMDFLNSLITDIEMGLHDPIKKQESTDIDQGNALKIIRNILSNFYLHIKEMYQADLHGKGTIQKEDLEKISIGNEYDVQRILFSLIKPIFPKARLEVSEDDGYGTIRYDIYLNDYNLVIEVKCTRPSLSEKKLKEEIASDIYHYKHDFIFFFIYDKEQKIKNKEVFVEAYSKDKESVGKKIETIIAQPLIL